MTLIYKPIAVLLGLLAGFIGRKIFDQIWGLIDKDEPPKPNTELATWPKVLGAAAVEGMTFRVTRAAVERAGAKGFASLTGTWPGEREPEPE
jgi:xanthosine utilization system XapX-like protein